jgi:hypothetical protein
MNIRRSQKNELIFIPENRSPKVEFDAGAAIQKAMDEFSLTIRVFPEGIPWAST